MQKFNLQQLNEYVIRSKFTVEKHPVADLFIYGYETRKEGTPIVWDSVNIHLRGIILDGDGNVLYRSFKKFFTFKQYLTKSRILLTEGEPLKLPDCSFKIYEKVDGSMAVLYWVDDKPYLASQRSFTSPNAQKATEILYNKYSHLFNTLNKDATYIFEAIYPNTRVVVNYDNREDLILLGIIDNKTGDDLPIKNAGFPVTQDYTSEYGHINDLEELTNLNLPNLEGFVLHYENGLRLKLKFPWFTQAHLLTNRIIMNEQLLYENKQKLMQLLNLPQKRASNLFIWNCLKDGLPLSAITEKASGQFYTYGFEFWLNSLLDNFKNQFNEFKINNPGKLDIEIWNMIKPQEECFFDLKQRKGVPEYSTPMWNLLERITDDFVG